ncbi:hypothetical protein HD806DRAFT_513843 [Xylariaceae sp. AK1471]|nr:hypothetical protein HD806DRAFT_513843 [Xylariaceae sp. AK1471]
MPLTQVPEGQSQKENNTQLSIDIVAVHGLNPTAKKNHAFNTWTSSSGRLWLRDNLPTDLPFARIFLYEYDSVPVFTKTESRLIYQADDLLRCLSLEREHCRSRPIIFIAHSLGGILVKQTLVNAHNNSQYGNIKASTRGIAFFGTPHGGGNETLVAIGKTFSRLVNAFSGSAVNDLMEALSSGSTYSNILKEQWKHQMTNYKIVSFYENGDIVPRKSAILDLPSSIETIISMDAAHREMCRFDTGSPEGRKSYQRALQGIQILVKAALDSQGYANTSLGTSITERQQFLSQQPITFDAIGGPIGYDVAQNTLPGHNPDMLSSVPFHDNQCNGISQHGTEGAFGVSSNIAAQALQLRDLRNAIGNPVMQLIFGNQYSPLADNLNFLPTFIRSFAHYNYNDVFEEIRLARYPWTYEWVLGTDELRWWMEGAQARILWLTGNAGVGKSTITGYLAAELQSTRSEFNDEEIAVLKAFCHYQKNYSTSMVLSILIHQLLRRFPRLQSAAYETDKMYYLTNSQWRTPTKGKDRLATTLWTLFNDIVRQSGLKQVIIFVDSFDSLEDVSREELFSLLSRNFRQKPNSSIPAVKFFITSRPSSDVSEMQSEWRTRYPYDFRSMDITTYEDQLQHDVNAFMQQEFERFETLGRLASSDLDRIRDQIHREPSKNFLQATIYCKQFERPRPIEIRPVFEEASQDLEKIYQELLSQLPPDLQRSYSIFMASMAYSFEPLKMSDLALISYYELCHGSTRLAPRWPFNAEVEDRAQARGLERYLPFLRVSKSQHVSFLHDSVRDYCMRRSTNVASLLVPNTSEGHRRMALYCMICIVSNSQIQFPETRIFGYARKTDELLHSKAFLHYSFHHWHKHLLKAMPSHTATSIDDLELASAFKAVLYLWNEPRTRRFREVLLSKSGFQSLKYSKSVLELLSGLGLTSFLRMYLELLDTKSLLSTMTADAHRAVLLAVQGGHEACFEMLLDTFQITSLDGDKFRTIKADSAFSNSPRMMERISKLRESKIRELVESLVAAFMSGNKSGVQHLVNDENFSGLNHFGMNGLHLLFVSQSDSKELQNMTPTSDFYKEIREGSPFGILLAVAGLFLDQGISAQDTDNFGFTPLHWACHYRQFCRRPLIELLVSRGADPKAQSLTGLTPLHIAAYNTDSADALECLLEIGGSGLVGTVSRGHMTPLHWAVCNRSDRRQDTAISVEVLLRHGADWHAVNARGLTPINWATAAGAAEHLIYDIQHIYTRFVGIHIIPITYPTLQLPPLWRELEQSDAGVRRPSLPASPTVGQRWFEDLRISGAIVEDITNGEDSHFQVVFADEPGSTGGGPQLQAQAGLEQGIHHKLPARKRPWYRRLLRQRQ